MLIGQALDCVTCVLRLSDRLRIGVPDALARAQPLSKMLLDVAKVRIDGAMLQNSRVGVDSTLRPTPCCWCCHTMTPYQDDPTPARLEIALSDLELDDALSRLLVTVRVRLHLLQCLPSPFPPLPMRIGRPALC